MKLKLYRQSGQPVSLESRAAFEADWKVFYDKAAALAGLDMLKLQRFCRFGERQLTKRHNIEVAIDVPATPEAWEALIKSYEDCPVMIARTQDGTGIVAVLMDNLQST